MSASGAKHAAAANSSATDTESRSAMPITFSIVLTSPLPQYCADRMQAPEEMP